MTDDDVTTEHRPAWLSDVRIWISIVALVISILAIMHSQWTDRTSRECEFRYKAYDRLTELALKIDRQNKQTQDYMNTMDEQLEKDDPIGLAIMRMIDSITTHVRLIHLDRIAFHEKELQELRMFEARIVDEYEQLDKLRESGHAQPEDILRYAESHQYLWGKMQEMLDSAIDRSATFIMRKCA